MKEEIWALGKEYDEATHKKLGEALRQSGFEIDKKLEYLADFSQWIATSSEGILIIESELYIGLSVAGEASLIEKVKKIYNSRS